MERNTQTLKTLLQLLSLHQERSGQLKFEAPRNELVDMASRYQEHKSVSSFIKKVNTA